MLKFIYHKSLDLFTIHVGMVILMIIAILISSGCGLRYGKKDTAKPAIGVPLSEVDKLLAQIEQKNAEVTTFKGVGRIKFRRKGKLHISRGLWAGIKPDKFRMEILNPARQPAVSIASDGKWLYLLSYSSGQFHKESTDNADLSKFISTPVRISDIITLLSDGIPLHSYHEAFLKPDSSGTGYIIVLKKRWRGVIEKIYLDEKKTDVRQVEIYNLSGLVYRVSLYRNRHKKSADGFKIPPGYDKAIVITNRDGPALQIDVDKYWVNVPVSTTMFVLNPPSAED